MNIIKLKDIVMTEECSFTSFFNDNLKGKYAYWVKMRYIFPLESLDYKTYIKYEQLDTKHFLKNNMLPYIDLYSEECCMMDFSQKYIDCDETELLNTQHLNKYILANAYAADLDIDIDELRNFRTWLAKEILFMNSYLNILTGNEIHMLSYYENDMYNDIVKQLNVFGDENMFTLFNNENTCSCCTTNISGLYNNILTPTCNALNTYTTNIHKFMVQTFENVDFWTKFDKKFLETFKRYIDNILKVGFIINDKANSEIYIKCNCNNVENISTEILKKLSEALQYIINNELTGHLNFIHDALYNWAEKLYDKMSWNIK